jgi:hypothetical protein
MLMVMTACAQVTTNLDLTSVWRYSAADLDGLNWQAPKYDDSAWPYGPAILWVDVRGYVQPGIPVPNTEMPSNPSTPYPFITYYLRTHFAFTNASPGTPLMFTAYLDDGAVFYLNGKEIARPNMPPVPAAISNNTLADAYTCSSGNATCPYDFIVSGDLATNLAVGDNVLAVEVHNYSAFSPDITFGVSLTTTNKLGPLLRLDLGGTNRMITLSWTGVGFVLQQADSLNGLWTNVPGPISSSPYSTTASNAAEYFRLRK